MKPVVAFVTTVFDPAMEFSVTRCTGELIRMLIENGYNPVRVLVQEGQPFEKDTESGPEEAVLPFPELAAPSVWNSGMVDLRPVLPALHLASEPSETFEDEVERIEKVLLTHLEGAQVAITQDIMLLDTYMPHNVAVRRVAEKRPDLLWLHWLHSIPQQSPQMEYPWLCRGVMPPGYLVYPNKTDRAKVIRTYKMNGQEFRVVANGAAHVLDDLRMKKLNADTKLIVQSTRFLEAEIGIVYPAHMGPGKAAHKIIYLMGGLLDHGHTSCLIGVDWQSQGAEFLNYKAYCHQLAEELGVADRVFFTSELSPKFEQQVPHDVILELMEMAILYVHPSRAETSSLTTREAILTKCVLALNHDLPAMREMYGGMAEFFDFGSIESEREYRPSEQAFWADQAVRLISSIQHKNQVSWTLIQARKLWGVVPEWRNLEPLLYLEPKRGFQHTWKVGVSATGGNR